MYGSLLFRQVSGKFDHFSLKTNLLRLSDALPDTGVISRGTMVDFASTDNEEMVLGSGSAIGYLTQSVDGEGLTGLQGFQDFTIGKLDRKVKKGQAVSIRQMHSGAFMEFEGLGNALPGNLVCTSGTGLLSNTTAKKSQLSVLNGCWRLAQSGEMVLAIMEKSDVTPLTGGNLRIMIKMCSPYVKA